MSEDVRRPSGHLLQHAGGGGITQSPHLRTLCSVLYYTLLVRSSQSTKLADDVDACLPHHRTMAGAVYVVVVLTVKH